MFEKVEEEALPFSACDVFIEAEEAEAANLDNFGEDGTDVLDKTGEFVRVPVEGAEALGST